MTTLDQYREVRSRHRNAVELRRVRQATMEAAFRDGHQLVKQFFDADGLRDTDNAEYHRLRLIACTCEERRVDAIRLYEQAVDECQQLADLQRETAVKLADELADTTEVTP